MLASVLQALGAFLLAPQVEKSDEGIHSVTLLFEIVILIVPSAAIEPESAAPSSNGLLAAGSGLVAASGGPTCPYLNDGVPLPSVNIATYLLTPLPKSQMMYHWLLGGTTLRLATFIVQVNLFAFGFAGSNVSATQTC